MRKLQQADLKAIAEALGYFSDGDSEPYLSSGLVTGPKGFWLGPIGDDEYLTVDELTEFLTEHLELLPEDVEEAISRVIGDE